MLNSRCFYYHHCYSLLLLKPRISSQALLLVIKSPTELALAYCSKHLRVVLMEVAVGCCYCFEPELLILQVALQEVLQAVDYY